MFKHNVFSYATRVWAPLIGKPDILFDVMDTEHVEPCMDILRQVFVESCTQTTHKISKVCFLCTWKIEKLETRQ